MDYSQIAYEFMILGPSIIMLSLLILPVPDKKQTDEDEDQG